jgi:hypothetical protein
MSYRLNDHETISDGIKRIVVEEIDKALDRMQARSVNQDDVIHDVRVCLKKIRAVLWLVQPDMDGDVFRQELVCYRDAGRACQRYGIRPQCSKRSTSSRSDSPIDLQMTLS